MRRSWLSRFPRPVVLAVSGSITASCLIGMVAGNAGGSLGLAAPSTPPVPPTFIPTPIGPPPGPPTPIRSATAIATAVSTPVVTPVQSPTALISPTAGTVARAQFSLDAVRVSRPDNAGDLTGLSAVRPGSKVWLMMYYTVSHLSRPVMRITTYTVKYQGKIIFKVAYKGKMSAKEIGKFSRYTVYTVPQSLPFGKYTYRATLSIAKQQASRAWKFSVAKKERMATTGHR